MIGSAQQHVYIQSPFFIPDPTIADALRLAALADVDVRLMLSARPSGNRLPQWAGNTYVADIVASGVRVFLYTRGYLHAKTLSVDGRVCTIGSANIDIRSFSINYELNVVLYSERLARQLETDFRHDLAFCTEFDPDADRRRPAAARFRDSVARLFSPLL
jgi:cardiolipin synthase